MFTPTQRSAWIQKMPKVELHVHLEGAIEPETLMALAERNHISLPAHNLEELKAWYTFTDFPHFAEVYVTQSTCLRTLEDIERITLDFLKKQAAQNILYSEVTYTAYTHYKKGLAFNDQMAAIQRARQWAETHLGVRMGLVIDIPRDKTAEQGALVAEWVSQASPDMGVVALGLGGIEVGNPPERFHEAFQMAQRAGVPCVLHAGETMGPESIWSALREGSVRIGHGVHCVEDPLLLKELAERQIPLEVCPTSNLCLKEFKALAEHPLPRLLSEGLCVTLNSDDPAMFNTDLTREYQICAETWNWDEEQIKKLVFNAAQASLLPLAEKQALVKRLQAGFAAG